MATNFTILDRADAEADAEDLSMPSDMATGQEAEIEEERRLLYVAMTRAQQHLAVIAPQRFCVTQQRRNGDSHLYAALTRFIPGKVAKLFERVGAGSVVPPSERIQQLPLVDLSAKVQGMWD